jgi:hypothetical protein
MINRTQLARDIDTHPTMISKIAQRLGIKPKRIGIYLFFTKRETERIKEAYNKSRGSLRHSK